jgi:hypothetical protein
MAAGGTLISAYNGRTLSLFTRAVRAERAVAMDKKVKKKAHVLQQRIQTLRQQLAGAKKQMDDPAELKSLEQQLAAAEAELAKVKS